MLGTLDGVGGMQWRAGLRLLNELADDGAFEQHGVVLALPLQPEKWNFAERRDGRKPVRLVGEIDRHALVRDAFLVERYGSPLDVGAQMVADEG